MKISNPTPSEISGLEAPSITIDAEFTLYKENEYSIWEKKLGSTSQLPLECVLYPNSLWFVETHGIQDECVEQRQRVPC